jgi:hypothetical protein
MREGIWMTTRMTIAQAATYLGVSRTKVWKLLNEGRLSASVNPLDHREKLIPLQQVERLKTSTSPSDSPSVRPRFASDGVANNPDAPSSDELEHYLREYWNPVR